MAYCIGLDACRFIKSDILLHVRVTHEDIWRRMLKNETNFKKLVSILCFTPNCVPRGDLLSIAMYIISSIFRLLTVTHGQGSMPIKNNALFINKQHPNDYQGVLCVLSLSRYLCFGLLAICGLIDLIEVVLVDFYRIVLLDTTFHSLRKSYRKSQFNETY